MKSNTPQYAVTSITKPAMASKMIYRLLPFSIICSKEKYEGSPFQFIKLDETVDTELNRSLIKASSVILQSAPLGVAESQPNNMIGKAELMTNDTFVKEESFLSMSIQGFSPSRVHGWWDAENHIIYLNNEAKVNADTLIWHLAKLNAFYRTPIIYDAALATLPNSEGGIYEPLVGAVTAVIESRMNEDDRYRIGQSRSSLRPEWVVSLQPIASKVVKGQKLSIQMLLELFQEAGAL